MSNATGGSMTNDTNTRAPQAPQGDGVAEALRSAREEIEQARASVSGDDGYNYASGEEYGLRRAVIILDKALAEKLATVDAAIARRAPQAQGDGVAEALRKLIADVSKVAPGPWEVDTEKQGDAPDRHNEYVLLDARGYRLLGTENCDHRFGEIMIEYDEYGATAWNEPSRVLLEYIATLSPDKILAALAHKEGAPTADLARAVEAHDHLTKLLDEARHVYAAALDQQVKHMVERFLRWRLPENFNPDGGISFKATYNEHSQFGPSKAEPVGTNLFDYSQAEAMVRHMLGGLPAPLVEGWRPPADDIFAGVDDLATPPDSQGGEDA